jgi:hypothetical protein
VDHRKHVPELLGQDARDGNARPRDPAEADVDAWRQVGATTNLNEPTTTRVTK